MVVSKVIIFVKVLSTVHDQVYDYFLTLPDEISLVWFGRWSYMKYLYLLTRYLPIADVVVNTHSESVMFVSLVID